MDMAEFAKLYYPEYDQQGVLTSKTSGGLTFSNRRMTPETHPWAFTNPDEVQPDGYIRDGSVRNTGTGYEQGRKATPEEIRASTAKNNYFRNGGQGMDPRLMQGMTRNDFRSKDYNNQYGRYTSQHAFNDPAREAAGLDPWTESRSRFSGKDMQGNPLDYQNQKSIWGNRGPGFEGSTGPYAGSGAPRRIPLPGEALSGALRNPTVGGGQPPPGQGSTSPPGQGSGLPGGGTLPGGPPSGGGSYVGLPPGHSSFGGPGPKQPASAPAWWQQMMMNMPGQQAGPTGNGGAA